MKLNCKLAQLTQTQPNYKEICFNISARKPACRQSSNITKYNLISLDFQRRVYKAEVAYPDQNHRKRTVVSLIEAA